MALGRKTLSHLVGKSREGSRRQQIHMSLVLEWRGPKQQGCCSPNSQSQTHPWQTKIRHKRGADCRRRWISVQRPSQRREEIRHHKCHHNLLSPIQTGACRIVGHEQPGGRGQMCEGLSEGLLLSISGHTTFPSPPLWLVLLDQPPWYLILAGS